MKTERMNDPIKIITVTEMSDTKTMKLFVYGSLMTDRVLKRVVQLPAKELLIKHSARLYGYRRFKVRGQLYPGIVRSLPVQENVVDGHLIDLPAEPDQRRIWLNQLDRFEGVSQGLYTRLVETVLDLEGNSFKAFVYLYTGDTRAITADLWDPAQFDVEKFISTEEM